MTLPRVLPMILLLYLVVLLVLLLFLFFLLGHQSSGLHEGVVDANRSRQRRPPLGGCQMGGLVSRQGFTRIVLGETANSSDLVGWR